MAEDERRIFIELSHFIFDLIMNRSAYLQQDQHFTEN
jgi:hypothetical protein